MIRILSAIAIGAALAQPNPLVGFAPLDPATWPVREATEPLALIAPLHRDFGGEGNRSLRIELRRDGAGRMILDVERLGLTDDSVMGDQHRAVIARAGGVWRIEAIGRRHRCWPGRGPANWTIQPCS